MFQRQHLIVIERLFVEAEKNLRQVRFDNDENIQHHHSCPTEGNYRSACNTRELGVGGISLSAIV
jgi:hypothetical protein